MKCEYTFHMTTKNSWTCKKCGTSEQSLRYPSGKMSKCMDCQRWYNISVNAKRPRKNKPSPELLLSERGFLDWCRSRPRQCEYCGIPEHAVPGVGLKTQTGHSLAALGIDRIDSSLGYSTDNIVFCCFACNKAKGDVFSHEEMKQIGKAISLAWDQRMEKK